MSYTRGPGVSHWHSIDTMSITGRIRTGYGEGAWPSANLAIYVPVAVLSRVIVVGLWYANSSGTAGTYDIGLYNDAGTRLLSSGSTSKIGTETEVVWDCTDTTIGPGVYYLALALSNTGDQVFRANCAAPLPAAIGCFTEASANPLPATATFSIDQTQTTVPALGMFLNTLVT